MVAMDKEWHLILKYCISKKDYEIIKHGIF